VIHALRHSAAHVFVDQLDLPVLGDDDQHHLGRVLRLRDGESVTASNGRGQWRACVWRDGALEVAGEVVASAPPSVRCAVAFTPVKGDRNEWAVQKLTEIGIDEVIILAPTQHSVVRWSDADKQLRKLRVVAREAAMQSRRVWLPNIVGLAALREVCAGDGAAVADPDGVALHAGVSLVVVGPEGGFAEDELPAGVPRVQLGDTILRAETATLVAATLLVARRASW
jgi:16S rRNA (uracil1498-N3)-methyltransferase